MKVKSKISFALLTCCLLLVVAFALFHSSFMSKPTTDIPQPQKVTIAVIDMNKALQAHPKYQEGAALQQQLNTLLASQQALANQQVAAASNNPGSQSVVPQLDTAGGQNVSQQQQQLYQEKMSAKQAQLKTAFDAQYAAARTQASAEYDAYSAQLDKADQPTMFDIQLKLKTLQLSKEDGEALQAQVDKIHKEKADKLAAKEKQISTALTAQMTAEQQRSAAQLESYGKQVASDLRSSAAAAPIEAPVSTAASDQVQPSGQTPSPSPDALAAINKVKAQLAALQALMIQDIENQCGKIAQAKGYEIVVTNVTANIHADDITAEVIAQFNN
jgi:hypothetical protein